MNSLKVLEWIVCEHLHENELPKAMLIVWLEMTDEQRKEFLKEE